MKHALVVTLVGPDRPGIVERLAEVVAAHEADWLESRMANLAGQFAGIVRVDVDAARRETLAEALEALAGDSLALTVAEGRADPSRAGSPEGTRLVLELTGLDHPGIVRDVSGALADCGVSVESLETERASGSMSGETLFRARATLALPEGVTVDTVDAALQTVSAGLMIDVVPVED